MSNEKNTITINKQTVLIAALVVLVLVAGFQAVSLFNLKSTLGESGTSITAKATSPAPSGGTSSTSKLKKNLDSLPSMVGGC